MNIKGPCLCLVMFFSFTFKKYGMFGNKVHMGRYMFTRKWSMFFCPLYFEVGKEGQYISFPSKPNIVPTPLYTSILELKDGDPISKKEFANKYGLCCEFFCPKCVKFVKGHFSKGHHQDLSSYCEQKWPQL